jgi:hypothetical protein
MKTVGAAALCALAVVAYGCGGGGSKPPQIKNNGTCTFSGASSTQGARPCTVAGAFTTSEQVGVIEISYNTAADYDGGVVVGETLFGTITFPAAPAPGTYASSNGNAFVPASTQIQLADAVTNADWSASTGQGSFTLVLTSVSQVGTDPDIGTIYLPKGTLDATLVPITGASGNARVQATF